MNAVGHSFSRCLNGLLKHRFGTGGRPLGSPGRLCSAASGIQLVGGPREGAVGHCTTVGTPRGCGSGREECWSFVEIAVAGMWSLTPPPIREARSEITRDFPGSTQVSAKPRSPIPVARRGGRKEEALCQSLAGVPPLALRGYAVGYSGVMALTAPCGGLMGWR